MEDYLNPYIVCSRANNYLHSKHPGVYQYSLRHGEPLNLIFDTPLKVEHQTLYNITIYGIPPYGSDYQKAFDYFYNLNLLAYKHDIEFIVDSDASSVYITTNSIDDAVKLQLLC